MDITTQPPVQPIGQAEIRKAMKTLRDYKAGKAHLEEKIVTNEKWWKMRHWAQLADPSTKNDPKPASGWLFNTIISKHADFMDSYPTADVLPREAGDKDEAEKLTSIIPVILDQNDFESEFSHESWYKLKNGTGCYGVFWDPTKFNGLGDVTIKEVDLLSLYWEPGITDIQKSRNIFSVELVDNEKLEEMYPVLKGKLKTGDDGTLKKYVLDDTIDTTNKSLVVDWYYKKFQNGKTTLQFCKFCNEEVLYATENDNIAPTQPKAEGVTDENGEPIIQQDGTPAVSWVEEPTGPSTAERGWYDDGNYPFVFDKLFPEEGLPTGFGFVDVCKNDQTSIDLMRNAFEKNVLFNSQQRYFVRNDGGLNEEEFNNPNQTIIHVDGQLGQDSLAPLQQSSIPTNSLDYLQDIINEMKETSGNRDATTGGTQSGVTAASAIAAIQETAGKTSRDMIKTTYRAYKQVINLVIERIRQFYDVERTFRITGQDGQEQFVSYSNAGIRPQNQGSDFGVDMGYRLPVFDLKISAEKESAYTQLSQNEMALQFYNSGFFDPQQADQVLACLDMMNFEGKTSVIQKVQQNGTMYQQMLQMQQQMLQLAQMVDAQNTVLSNEHPDMVQPSNLADAVAQGINLQAQSSPVQRQASAPAVTNRTSDESAITTNARAQANAATKPR